MSLKIANARIREAVLKGVPSTGPPSLRTKWARLRYRSPEGLNEAFGEAMKIVDVEAQQHRDAAQKASDMTTKEKELAKADMHNPEVKYNHLVRNMDLSMPVYKNLAERDWKRREMLVLMQRLEQHHVIPDTLPTLDPQADVQLQFITPNMRLIEPGEWIVNEVCSRKPHLKIRDFGVGFGETAKYTVMIVNPDHPDLENDTFQPVLHFAAVNVSASLTNPVVDLKNAVVPYLPPHPEKNGPAQRMCVWVCRQSEDLDSSKLNLERENFDIRSFVAEHNLRPVGASLWRSKWDVSTEKVRSDYNLGPGRVYFRARTAKPEDALLHVREAPKWRKIDGLE